MWDRETQNAYQILVGKWSFGRLKKKLESNVMLDLMQVIGQDRSAFCPTSGTSSFERSIFSFRL
jgi:hypothetical protein